jgi:retron-type reverse transcriptase
MRHNSNQDKREDRNATISSSLILRKRRKIAHGNAGRQTFTYDGEKKKTNDKH